MSSVQYIRLGQAPDAWSDCGAVRYQTIDVPSGDAGIRMTAEIMRDLIRKGQGHPVVRAHAEAAVRGLPPARPLEELRAVYDYIGDRVDYRRDPLINEWIRTPWYILACELDKGIRPQLDCDDLTTLSLAMITALGHDAWIHVDSQPPARGEYNHVYGIAVAQGSRVPIDLTRYHVDPRTPWPAEFRSFELPI